MLGCSSHSRLLWPSSVLICLCDTICDFNTNIHPKKPTWTEPTRTGTYEDKNLLGMEPTCTETNQDKNLLGLELTRTGTYLNSNRNLPGHKPTRAEPSRTGTYLDRSASRNLHETRFQVQAWFWSKKNVSDNQDPSMGQGLWDEVDRVCVEEECV